MDALQQAKIKCLKDALKHTNSLGNFIFSIDEKTGKVVISSNNKNNKNNKNKDESIKDRFEILDL
jgi:hypothetical protein